MDMIERVGRALAKEEGYAYDPMPYDARAIVAIGAMREPAKSVLTAMGDYIYEGWADSAEGRARIALEAWRSAIDAALSSYQPQADVAE